MRPGFAERKRPPSNFGLKRLTGSLKCATGQNKNMPLCQVTTQKQNNVPRVIKNLTMQTVDAISSRLCLDPIETKSIGFNSNASIRNKLKQHESPTFATVNITKPASKLRPISNFRRVLSPQIIAKTEIVAVRDIPKNQYQKDFNDDKQTKPGLKLSPASIFRDTRIINLDKQRPINESKSKNFVDVNKKHAFENNIAKYCPKMVEIKNKQTDCSQSANISRSCKNTSPKFINNEANANTKQLDVVKAISAQYKTRLKSPDSALLVPNKENGFRGNNNTQRGPKAAQKLIKTKSSEPVFRKASGSLVESARQDHMRFMQRKAANKFFCVN